MNTDTVSRPTSIRLSRSLDEYVAREAKRTKRTKSSVLESLIAEAARARQFPGIAFRGDDWDRRPWVVGTGLDVWEIVQAFQDFGSVSALTSGSRLGEREAALALNYYDRFPDEIDACIEENRTDPAELKRRYPHITLA
jgi:uncharacterized protein (DUF433 family)